MCGWPVSRGYKLEAAGLLAGAVVAGTWAGAALVGEIQLDRNGVVVPAKVRSVGWERKDLRVKVEFTTRGGTTARSVLDKNEMGGDDHLPHAGDVIDVRYDPGDPSGSATKASRGSYYRYIWSLIIIGLAGGVTWWSLKLFRRPRIPSLGPVVTPQDILNWPNDGGKENRPGSGKASW